MTRQELQDVLGTIQYKKGWKIRLSHTLQGSDHFESYHVVEITMPVEDVETGKPSTIITNVSIDDLSSKYLVDMIFHQVVSMERHEAAEWFKVKGVAIYNEHKDQPVLPALSLDRNNTEK